jgi:hypothetical protein
MEAEGEVSASLEWFFAESWLKEKFRAEAQSLASAPLLGSIPQLSMLRNCHTDCLGKMCAIP